MLLKEAYEEIIAQSENRIVEGNPLNPQPDFTIGVISPESKVEINLLGDSFKLDKEAMLTVLEELEKKINIEEPNILEILTAICNAAHEFLGGFGDAENRKRFYYGRDVVALSEIQGKKIGLCAERSAIAHNCLAVLEKAGVIKSYISTYTVTHMTNDGKRGSHCVVTLINKNIERNSILFDIENPIGYGTDDKIYNVPAVYVLGPGELKDFKDGKSLHLKTPYDDNLIVDSDKNRQYGYGIETKGEGKESIYK